jgi:heat shock protein HtpX
MLVLIIINWIFNSLILASSYLLTYVLIQVSEGKSIHYLSDFTFLRLGLISVLTLTLFGLTKMGDFCLRYWIDARTLNGRERYKLEPILAEVLNQINQVKKTKYNLDQIRLLISDLKLPNAKAFGLNSIIITAGLLATTTEDELKSILAHEVAHLYYRNGITLNAILYGSLVGQIVRWGYLSYSSLARTIANMVAHLLFRGRVVVILLLYLPLMGILPLLILVWLGNHGLNLSLLYLGRRYEYQADKFVKEVGYVAGLISFLEQVDLINCYDNSLLGRIFASHPAPMQRIGALEENFIQSAIPKSKLS